MYSFSTDLFKVHIVIMFEKLTLLREWFAGHYPQRFSTVGSHFGTPHRVPTLIGCCGLGSKIIGVSIFTNLLPIDPKPYYLSKQLRFPWFGFRPYSLIRIGWTLGGNRVQPPLRTYLSRNSVPVRPVHLYIITYWVHKIK